MLNGKNVSSFEIIRRVYRDSGIKTELPYQDAVEWTVDCLDLIAVPMAYTPQIAFLTIEEYRAKLPCNYKQMTQATGALSNGRIFPMTESLNTFHPTNPVVNDNINLSTQGNTSANNVVIDLSYPIGYDAAGNPVFNFIGSNNSVSGLTPPSSNLSQTQTDTLFSLPGNLASGPTQQNYNPHTYSLNSDYIQTSYRDGYAAISYIAYPFDCEGFPMIPDDVNFKLAVQWYIQNRLDYVSFRTGDIADKVSAKSEQESLWYIGKAQNSGNAPNVDKMEGMRKTFTKLMLPSNWHKRAFNRS